MASDGGGQTITDPGKPPGGSLRAALLSPGPRDRWYSANASYAQVLADAVLGALAMLHAHCRQGGPGRPVPVVLTCGAIEENLSNNRLVRQALRARGDQAALRARGDQAALYEVPDTHNYTAWRDAFDPYLTRLLRQVCG